MLKLRIVRMVSIGLMVLSGGVVCGQDYPNKPIRIITNAAGGASGVPGYESASLTLLFAPAKTPDVIINRLSQEMVRFLKTPEAKAQLFISGAEAVGSSPQQLAATMKAEMDRMGKVIKDAGIKLH